jgi:hypothetical protein
MNAISLKAGIASGVIVLALAAGGLFYGTTLVGAQTPSPTPSAPEGQTPAPEDGGTPRTKEECDRSEDSSGSSSGATGSGAGSDRASRSAARF